MNTFSLPFGKDKSIAKKAAAESAAKADPSGEADSTPLGGEAQRRRLRHVSELAVRGVDLNLAGPPGYFLEVAVCGEEEVLESSDTFRTRNPTWTPVRGIREGRHLTAFELRAVSLGSCEAFWKATVRLAELEPLCSNLDEADVMPPLSAPLLRLGKRWYAPPDTFRPTAASLLTPQPKRRSNVVKRIQASDICTAGDTVGTMLEKLHLLRAQSASVREAMEQSLASAGEIRKRRELRLQCENRNKQWRLEVERRRSSVEELRSRLDSARTRRAQREAELQRGQAQLHEAQEEQQCAATSLAAVYRGLRTLWQQLRFRQMLMLQEVCSVYPIEDCGQYWSIRGLTLGGIETLGRQDLREEESVSTALGFLAHLLMTLASILEVPLRVAVHQAGCSRSMVSDPHYAGDPFLPNEAPRWPLYYGRGLEKSRFVTALRLLRDSLHQFLYSRGYFDEHEAGNGNLLGCAALILRQEMYGDETL